jgi:hypothetical protein
MFSSFRNKSVKTKLWVARTSSQIVQSTRVNLNLKNKYYIWKLNYLALRSQLKVPKSSTEALIKLWTKDIVTHRMHIIMAGSMDILLVVYLFMFQMELLLLHQSAIQDLGMIALLQKIVAHIINWSRYTKVLVEEV